MSDQHWLISIQIDGKQILVIEPDFVGVREMSEEDRQVVCRAAQGLAKFVGCNEEVLDQIETEKPSKGLGYGKATF